jgi:ribosomal protein L11 methyltransferase
MRTTSATALETVTVSVPRAAVPAFEAALAQACRSVGLFGDEEAELWTVEGVKERGADEGPLAVALALAQAVSGVAPAVTRRATAADGWLARTRAAFPEQTVGRRFAIRGTHIRTPPAAGRITLVLDAAAAFGSGEHGSTRGCLRALERVAYRRPRRLLDLGTGSGILALAAARLLHRRVLATDIDAWSVRTAAANARRNHLGRQLRLLRADGWSAPGLAAAAPYDLIFANILARPLCRLARQSCARLAAGGTLILAGLLRGQACWVLAAHRRHGVVLERKLYEGPWCTLILRRRR